MKSVHLFSCLFVFFTACSGVMTTDKDFHQSTALLDSTIDTCLAHMENQPLAVKKCFPIIDNKDIMVRVTEIQSTHDLVVWGSAGRDRYKILCKPGKADEKRILEHPETIKLGEKYIMRGKFSRFAAGRINEYFTLEDCTLREPGPRVTKK